MALIQEKSCRPKRNLASEAFIGLFYYRSTDEDYKDSLNLNKPSTRPFQALLLTSKDPNANRYSQYYLNQII